MLHFGSERGDARLLERYLVERELADRLRAAPREARAKLYTEVYDELFRRLPHHPQLVAKEQGAERRRRKVEGQMRYLHRFLDSSVTFAEIGAGDCALSLRAAEYAGRVYAIDVSRQITRGLQPPANFSLLLTDGPRIPLPDECVHFVLSEELMEHLHPDDAREQLGEIHRILVPDGRYLCSTPNRLLGPDDVSRYFDEEPRGLHLKEYAAAELRPLFREAGFVSVRFLLGARGRFVAAPYLLVAALERAMSQVPSRLRRRAHDVRLLRALFGVRALAVKAGRHARIVAAVMLALLAAVFNIEGEIH